MSSWSNKTIRFPGSSSSSSSRAGSSSHSSRFTAEMQDRQARNKDPVSGLAYGSSHDEGATDGASQAQGSKKPSRVAYAEDAYETLERRRWAATILDSPELLMMHALSRGDSVPGTKQHFTKIICGYEDPPKHKDKKAALGKEKEKEKEKPTSHILYEPFTSGFEM